MKYANNYGDHVLWQLFSRQTSLHVYINIIIVITMHMHHKIHYNGTGCDKTSTIRRDMLWFHYVHTSSTPPSSHLRIMLRAGCGSVFLTHFASNILIPFIQHETNSLLCVAASIIYQCQRWLHNKSVICYTISEHLHVQYVFKCLNIIL